MIDKSLIKIIIVSSLISGAVLGIIPLYHSIEAWKKNRKSDVSYVISLKKAYSWTKRIFIALLIIWIVAAILFFGGYYFR